MKAREWRIKPPHIYGTVEDCIGGREVRYCEVCGACEAEISVPDRVLPTTPSWPGFLSFVARHQNCPDPPAPPKPLVRKWRR